MKRRIIITLFLVAITTLILVVPTFADDEIGVDNLTDFYSVLRLAIERGESDINIKSLNIDRFYIDTYYRSFIWENPDISFCVDKTLSYNYIENTGIVVSVKLFYDNTETIISRKKWLDQEINIIAKNIDPDWTDIQKLLWINDYICDNYRYDLNTMNRTAYDLLQSGSGICEGYAALFTLLAQKCNIPVSYCFSQELQHIWNMVMIDNEWYHIDTTWNDTYTDRYEYFLLSDMENYISRGDSFDVNQLHAANSPKYDNAFWRNDVYSSFVFDEPDAYFIQGKKLMKVNLSTLATESIRFLSDEYWRVPNEQNYYSNKFYDLTNVGDLLIYNTATKIYVYSISTNKHFLLNSIDTEKNAEIYSIRYVSEELVINRVSNLQSDMFVQETVTIPSLCTATYYLDGNIYDTQTYCSGMSLVYPNPNPFKTGYVFIGWSIEEGTTVKNDITLYPMFEIDVTKCNVIFVSDENPYRVESIPIGTIIVPPQIAPTKADDEYYTYNFVGWQNYYDGIAANGSTMVFIAVYEKSLRSYTVNFFDGSELKSTIVCDAGTSFASLRKPVVANKNDEYGNRLIFMGWRVNSNEPTEKVLQNIDAYAHYELETVYVTIKYYNDNGELFYSQAVETGSLLKFIEDVPKKAGTEEYIYVFDQWIGLQEGTAIYDNVDLIAHYRKIQIQNQTQTQAPQTSLPTDNEYIDAEHNLAEDQLSQLEKKIILLVIGTTVMILIAIAIYFVSNRRHQ